MRFAISTLLCLLLLLLAACSQTPPLDNSGVRQAAALREWQVSGKLGLRTPAEAKSVSFDWLQRSGDFTLQLYGLLGLGNASLRHHDGISTLKTADFEESSSSTETLVLRALGTPVPVNELHYWLRGLAAPDSTITQQEVNGAGQLDLLEQREWLIRFLDYHPADPVALPRKIVATHGDIKLTLILKRWHY